MIFIDLETERFGPANMAPNIICLTAGSIYDRNNPDVITEKSCEGGREEWEGWFDSILSCRLIVGQNVAYDMGCICAEFPNLIPKVFAAYAEDRITDTMLRMKLIDIAEGKYRGERDGSGAFNKYGYSLADIALRLFNRVMNKDQDIRTGFAELKDVPVSDWPPENYQYAVNDVLEVRAIYLQQEHKKNLLEDEFRQARAAWALHLASAWGLKTDKAAVERLEDITTKKKLELEEKLKETGLIKKNGSRNMLLAQELMEKRNPTCPKTPTGRYQITEETCEESGIEELKMLSEYGRTQTLLSKDVTALAMGIKFPIHTYFDTLVETGRTSSSKPNTQNPRRAPGVRECYIPRPGHYYAACDFDKAELHTLAQVCWSLFKESRLREKLNEGFDPHLDLGAQLLGITYEQAKEFKKDPEVKNARQHAKAANFGFPGGMGANGFLEYALGTYGIEMTKTEAEELRERWLAMWPEMSKYFDWAKTQMQGGVGSVRHLFSNRIRGFVYFTAFCNSLFQGLCADGAKNALWAVAVKEYAEKGNALYGCRTVNFIHDELLVEVPNDLELAQAAAMELKNTMINAFNVFVPDVPVRASASLMKCWTKNAEPVFKDGLLQVWEETK